MSRLAIDSIATRKRSNVSRKPRANTDAIFQNYFGLLSHAENENVRDTVAVSDGLGTNNKLKKLKLKFGGVTHTIHTKSKSGNSDARNPKDNADNNDARSFDKKREQLAKLPRTDSCFASESHSHKRKATGQHSRKSKRANERRALDVGFSDEEDEDAELHFLEKISSSKRAVSRHNNNQGGIAVRGIGEDQDYVEEDRTSSDESILEGKKSKRESADLLVPRKQSTRNNRTLDSFKDVLSGPVPSFIDISDKNGKLSEEQLIKKAEAAKRRKIQSEKAAKEAEEAAIKKILGQDSARKKKEEKINKRRDEMAKEKCSKPFNLASNTVRWTMGPNGTVVTFSEDIGLPSIFQTIPNSYPPPRERCAGPNCTNAYKYRDSKSKLPLCSLGCYKAIHEKISPVLAY
ncbi:HIT zinc finger and PAPA-1 domain-containing protein [Trifolium repens]|nr:HIT zinc finger and PAPA-1 domain-containing protein [Trifolium repens]